MTNQPRRASHPSPAASYFPRLLAGCLALAAAAIAAAQGTFGGDPNPPGRGRPRVITPYANQPQFNQPPTPADLANADFKNTSLPFEKRVADLVSRLTLQEKAQQVQMYSPPIARLGVPACHWWTEGLHGVARAGRATIFPCAFGMSASWDPPLMQKVADAIADEARAKYISDPHAGAEAGAYRGIIVWAPTINMARDPRWGRTEECYGEDPLLSARLGVAFCKGLQGDDPKYLKTVATPKHFAMHSQETGRHNTSFAVSERTLHEYYLPAFEACIHEGKAASIMTAYNGINGTPCTVNHWLLTDLLRDQWHFDGAVVSDFLAPGYIVTEHHYSDSYEQMCADCINAGCDVLCDPQNFASQTASAVRMGILKESVLDRAVARGLMLRFRLGMFDPPDKVPFAKTPASVVGSKEHVNLALQMERESIVLLQNNPAPRGYGFGKLLPLDTRRIDSVAVLGPKANLLEYGNYSPNSPGGTAPSPINAIKAALGDRITIRTADSFDTAAAVKAAATSDIAIVVVGLGPEIEFEGIDKYTLDLPLIQKQLLEQVVRANPLTIVVMQGGSTIGCAWLKEHVPAIIMMWYPGEQGGNALADVLLGQTNPSGRITETFYRDVADLPRLDDYEISHGRTYMYITKPSTFPFGYGLSYTNFSYANLQLSAPEISQDQTLSVSADINNTGDFDGDEIAQLYIHKPDSAIKPRPIEQLKDFLRLSIPKGQTRTAHFKVAAKDLTYWDDNTHQHAIEPGKYELFIGASSTDIRLKGEFQVR